MNMPMLIATKPITVRAEIARSRPLSGGAHLARPSAQRPVLGADADR